MKIILDLAKNHVTIEGDGADVVSALQLVKEIAPKFSEFTITSGVTAQQQKQVAQAASAGAGNSNGRGAPLSLREFARSLNPANLSERIVAIAGYKARFEEVDSFSPKQMTEWFVQCNFEQPSQMPVAVFDARRKYGFLDKAGTGQWKLSTAGQNLVSRKLEEKENDPGASGS